MGGMGGGMGGMPGMGGMGGGGMGGFDLGDLLGGMGGGMPGMGGMGGGGMPGAFGGMPGGMSFGGVPTPQQPKVTPFNRIQPGTQVTILGLKSKPHLNNTPAAVQEYDEGKGRYIIKASNGEELAIKAANLVQMVKGVTVDNLTSQPQLNKQKGNVIGYDSEKGRYVVSLVSGKNMSLKPGNVILPPKTVVRAQGLVKSHHHNGKWGKIIKLDSETGRYSVQMDAALELKLKPENVLA
eukprot:m.46907 g.46907  ORF g.46907 m.46907 type:complete len:238 (+) comp10426_c0_seq2:1-714(+)